MSANTNSSEEEVKPAVSVGDMIRKYGEIFGLQTGYGLASHDAVHAMTGIGIGVQEELRIIAVETPLRDIFGYFSVHDAKEEVESGLAFGRKGVSKEKPEKEFTNGIENDKSLKIQQRMGMISDGEIEDLYALGVKMRDAIFKMTGRQYGQLKGDQVMELDFSRLDFSSEVLAIKKRHAEGENREQAICLAKVFRDAAKKKKDGSALLIPRAGGSWVKRVQKRGF